jgi:L-seryl-tRNA(Ser) seleniumtransferase
VHTGAILARLLGKPAIVVNNNAAGVFLVLNELAAGHEVLVSRGELIEIGDGFRIPEIMVRSGAVIREVGTTNRTRLQDYKQAINERTKLILRVHPSNFRISGFTERPELNELAKLGREHGIPVYEDVGSGCLVDLRPQGIDEPLVSESLDAGVNVVSFSCDKLLGGPQSGIIAGDGELIDRIRKNPLYRVFRVDKLIIESLECTLRHLFLEEWRAIPALQMILTSLDEIRQRADRLAAKLKGVDLSVSPGETAIGGGSTPDETLPTWVIEVASAQPNKLEKRLRGGDVPVIARIERDKVVLDMRTVADDEVDTLSAQIRAALAF